MVNENVSDVLYGINDSLRIGNAYNIRSSLPYRLAVWGSVSFVCLTVIISWSLAIITIVTILCTYRKHISYFYVISLNVINMIHALVNFPSNVILDLIGELHFPSGEFIDPDESPSLITY